MSLHPLKPAQVSSVFVSTILDYMRKKVGANAERFIAQLPVDEELVNREDEQIPLATYVMLLEEAAKFLNDPDLGLHFCEEIIIDEFGLFGHLVLNSKTLGDAFRSIERYHQIFQNEINHNIIIIGGKAHIHYKITAQTIPQSRQDNEMAIMGAVAFIRQVLNRHWSPDEVHFQHPAPQDISEHKRLLCEKLHFNSDSNKVIFNKELLDIPIRDADIRLSNSLRILMEQIQSFVKLPSEQDWLNDLNNQIINSITNTNGVPCIEELSKKLHMSSRTLQRRLTEHDLSYKDQVDNVRRELAINYLMASELSIQDIAFLIGYTDISTFNRAFKRWTSMTAAAYRKQFRSSNSMK